MLIDVVNKSPRLQDAITLQDKARKDNLRLLAELVREKEQKFKELENKKMKLNDAILEIVQGSGDNLTHVLGNIETNIQRIEQDMAQVKEEIEHIHIKKEDRINETSNLKYTSELASTALTQIKHKNPIALKKAYSELFQAIIVHDFEKTPELVIEFILNDGRDIKLDFKAQKNPTFNCPKDFLEDVKVGFVPKMVPRGGLEPPTQGFSVLCSTN